MKLKATTNNSEFNLHCPRCGGDEWSEEEWTMGDGMPVYHKCLHCGADAHIGNSVNGQNKITILSECNFAEFTEHTHDEIARELNHPSWEKPRVGGSE